MLNNVLYFVNVRFAGEARCSADLMLHRDTIIC